MKRTPSATCAPAQEGNRFYSPCHLFTLSPCQPLFLRRVGLQFTEILVQRNRAVALRVVALVKEREVLLRAGEREFLQCVAVRALREVFVILPAEELVAVGVL